MQCYVYAIDKLQNIYFRLESPESDGDQEKRDVSLITAKALRIHIDEFEKNGSV